MKTANASPLLHRKILVAKPGLDGHDAGAKVIALALRDAGASVIYTGLRKTPDYIARVAVDEDVDAIGLSILSGGHVDLCRAVMEELHRGDAAHIRLFVGGIIPKSDHDVLRKLGVAAIFTSEDRIESIVGTIAECLGEEPAHG